jgi:hypothetical protein
MKRIEKKVVIYIKRTKDNLPYATIYYQNGEDLQMPTALDLPTRVFANYIAKKTVTNEIKGIIYSFDEQKTVDRFDISPLTDNNYCIAGSEIGRKHTVDIIKRINDAASSPEVMAPVYLTDGTTEVLMNDELFRKYNDMIPATKEELDRKYVMIENIITENKGRVLQKAA